jgi:hypothetical protein
MKNSDAPALKREAEEKKSGAEGDGGETGRRRDFLATLLGDVPLSPKLRPRELVALILGRDPGAAGMDGVASHATASATADRQGAADASTRAADAADRRDRLRRGEDAPRGSEIDFEKILRQAGWTSADIRHAVS